MISHLRIETLNAAEVNRSGDYVLYWMIANRRINSNFALERAIEWCVELQKPLLILEPLRVGYRWASDRLHKFVIEGMIDHARECDRTGVTYYPYVEPERHAGTGLVEALSTQACVVVSDDYPAFFLPNLTRFMSTRLCARFEIVDSNGMLPMRAAKQVFSRAFDFRRFLQKSLRPFLDELPTPSPLDDYKLGESKIPPEALARWPKAELETILGRLGDLSIDHAVLPSSIVGGTVAAKAQLKMFLAKRLSRYQDDRSHPDLDAASGLSPYLHFGHISAHEVFSAAAKQEGWKTKDIQGDVTGSNTGWWGGSSALESFFDELITWRELGFNASSKRRDYERYESLPDWAKQTMEQHAKDPREFVYTLAEFEQAATHDEVWNAAQRQLVVEGRVQNYLRMLWGKKVLEWTKHPREALAILIELNNKYALDGRDPNSYSGIFWVFGRYDRAWGPERPIYGKIRYMSSDNTVRKLELKKYLARWSNFDRSGTQQGALFS